MKPLDQALLSLIASSPEGRLSRSVAWLRQKLKASSDGAVRNAVARLESAVPPLLVRGKAGRSNGGTPSALAITPEGREALVRTLVSDPDERAPSEQASEVEKREVSEPSREAVLSLKSQGNDDHRGVSDDDERDDDRAQASDKRGKKRADQASERTVTLPLGAYLVLLDLSRKAGALVPAPEGIVHRDLRPQNLSEAPSWAAPVTVASERPHAPSASVTSTLPPPPVSAPRSPSAAAPAPTPVASTAPAASASAQSQAAPASPSSPVTPSHACDLPELVAGLVAALEADSPTKGKPLTEFVLGFTAARVEHCASYAACQVAEGSTDNPHRIMRHALNAKLDLAKWPATLAGARERILDGGRQVPKVFKPFLVAPPPSPDVLAREQEAERARAEKARVKAFEDQVRAAGKALEAVEDEDERSELDGEAAIAAVAALEKQGVTPENSTPGAWQRALALERGRQLVAVMQRYEERQAGREKAAPRRGKGRTKVAQPW